MNVLLGKPPKMHRDVKTVVREFAPMDLTGVPLQRPSSTCWPTHGGVQALPHHHR